MAALTDKKIIHNIYKQATAEPYAFLYVNLTAKDINKMFWINFDKQITVDEGYEEEGNINEFQNNNIDNFNMDNLQIEDLRKY